MTKKSKTGVQEWAEKSVNPKPIPNYEEYYEIDENGLVFSIKRNIILADRFHPKGYKKILLNRPKKEFLIHRLVALTYLPNPNNYSTVNHKDGNKLNNNINNLEWISNKDNLIHAAKKDLISSKLSNDQVKQIRTIFVNWTGKEIAALFKINERYANQVKKGDRRNYV